MYTFEDYKRSADFLLGRIEEKPLTGIVLGSGLGFLADEAEDAVVVPYGEIPNFKTSTVGNHEGKLVFGRLKGRSVVVMKGRLHYYEGYSFEDTVYPIRVMKLLGCENVILTNASGGLDRAISPGDLMLITDHIKFFDESPLRGPNIAQFGPRFPDMSYTYAPRLQRLARGAAKELGLTLHEGVYAYMPGPQYETPAEIRALELLGAKAVGMSTVAEAIAANHCGLEVLGLSCVCNMATGVLDQPLSDEEVVETAQRERIKFSALVLAILEKMGKQDVDTF